MVADLEVGTGRTGGRDATTGVIPGKYALSVGCPDIEPPSGWKWTALSSVAQLESGHTPSRKHPEYWNGGIPWIGIKDATENHGRTIHDTHQHVSALGLQNSSARLLPANTVCLSRTASVGFVVVMGRPMATSQDFVNWVCGPEIDPHFLKYVLLLENEALWRFARGTTHQTIYYPEAKAFHVCLPPLPEQKAIARILGTLDDKIALNRRMNATLEAMARALFQSWFVDFDPVHRNMNLTRRRGERGGNSNSDLRASASPREPSDGLFPAAFQDSPFGEIPEGWTVGTLSDVASNPRRSVQPNEIAPNTPYIALEHMPRRSIALGDWEPSADVESGKTAFQKGEILFGKLRPYFHKVGVAPVSGVCSTDILVLAPSKPEWFGFLLGHASSDAAVQFADKHSTGTKMPRTNWTDLSSFKIAIPPPSIAKAFNDQIQPMIGRMHANLHQSRTLATLRDTLLPKLLSGDLPVAPAAVLTC